MHSMTRFIAHRVCVAQGLGAPEEDHLSPEERDALMAIRARKAALVADHRRKKGAANAQVIFLDSLVFAISVILLGFCQISDVCDVYDHCCVSGIG